MSFRIFCDHFSHPRIYVQIKIIDKQCAISTTIAKMLMPSLIPIGVNVCISICAYFLTTSLIPNLKEMFLKANIAGVDMSKKEKIRM